MNAGLILFIILILLAGLWGNVEIISAVREDDMAAMADMWIFFIFATAGDFLLLYLVFRKLYASVVPAFRLAKNALKSRRSSQKEFADSNNLLENGALYVNRLQMLRDQGISEDATKRTLHFCQLIESIAGKEQLQDCLTEVNERQSFLDEIDDIEGRILKIAESCKNAGDAEKCQYYLNKLKSTNKITPEINALEDECKALHQFQDAEKIAKRLCRKIFLWALAVLLMVSVVLYVEDSPYRKLRSMIKDQSLTAEMCSPANRNSKGSCYDYLVSERGRKLLASELAKLHREDDIGKAMWLLCVQPDCIDGYRLCASSSFINWIVNYAKTNGVRSTDEDSINKSWYHVTYSVGDCQIIMDSRDDEKSDSGDISSFIIVYGEKQIKVCGQSGAGKENIPIIK